MKRKNRASPAIKERLEKWLELTHKKYPPGKFVRGLVIDHTRFGVEIELRSDVRCRVAFKRLSWTEQKPDPGLVLPVGTRPVVRILEGGYERPEFALRASYRVMLADPYLSFLRRHPVGTVLQAKIESLSGKDGIEVKLPDGCTGIASWGSIQAMPSLVEGQTCKVKVVCATGHHLTFGLVTDSPEFPPAPELTHSGQAAMAEPIGEPLRDEDKETFREGAEQQVLATRYERDRAARLASIRHHGVVCRTCGFNFAVRYGSEASGFIHIHHLKPLSEIGEEYKVDPIKDLIPVCANCHAFIHLGGHCRDIEYVRRITGYQAQPQG